MTIYNDLKKSFRELRAYKGEIGLEIETEAKKVYQEPSFSFWESRPDNSLRGPHAREYVLKNPLLFKKEIPESLTEFSQKLKGIDFDQESITTSVHVHINFLNEKWRILGNFFSIYALTENLLTKFAGEARFSNCFCLPMCDAEETYRNILTMLSWVEQKRYDRIQISPDETKYAALNIATLTRFGSLEQRSMRGTTDTELIHKWVSLIYSILEYSRQDITPLDILKIWREKGVDILTDIFGKNQELIRCKNEEDLMDRNFWYTTGIACRIKNWRKLDKEEIKKKPTRVDLDKAAKVYFNIENFELLSPGDQRSVYNFLSEEDQNVILNDEIDAIDARIQPDVEINWAPEEDRMPQVPPAQVGIEPLFRRR